MTELSYEKLNKTVTQQMIEYFDYDIDKAIEEQKENFPNPDKLSYDDWKELNEEEQKWFASLSEDEKKEFIDNIKVQHL